MSFLQGSFKSSNNKKFNKKTTNYYRHLHGNYISSMLLKEIETKEIKGIIEQIKPNKSCGTDEIHPKVIKQTAPYISKPYISKILHHIFNLTFQTGTIPSALKISLITPVFKSANNTIFTNNKLQVEANLISTLFL